MNNYEMYDILPNGVVVFEDSKVNYINQHIVDIFNLGDFELNICIEIIIRTIQIENELELFEFFCNNCYFTHNKKMIQISHSKIDKMDIFSFMLIENSLLKDDLLCGSNECKKSEIDEKIAAHFKLKNIKKIGILTFYKGLPLKNIGTIIRVNSNSIEVKVDKKHNISLLDKDDVILIANKNKSLPVIYGHVEKSQKDIFTIKNFTLTKDDMHLRKNVRIKPENDIFIHLEDKKFQVYDLSEDGLSVHVDLVEDENLLKSKKSLDLVFFDKVAHVNTEYLKTVYNDSGEILKIIFKMYNSSESATIMKGYLMQRQNEVIKEIHQFIDKNPS